MIRGPPRISFNSKARGFSSGGFNSNFSTRNLLCIRCGQDPDRQFSQLRRYTIRRPKRSTVTSFPQFTHTPSKPLTKTPAFWGGIGLIGLLIWSPFPGWVLLGGMAYGIYRLFRILKRTQDSIFGPRNGFLSTASEGTSFLDSLFAQDPRTREVAAKIQEMAMERVEAAIEADEDGIRQLFPTRISEPGGEFHFTFPTEVSMINVNTQQNFDQDVTALKFQVQVKFNVYLATDGGRQGAEITAKADVIDDGVRLRTVDVRDLRGMRRVRLRETEEGGKETDRGTIGRGEGEGKTIDATKWTTR